MSPATERPKRAIPADRERRPRGCPDADWCRGNRCCYWRCDGSDEPSLSPDPDAQREAREDGRVER